MITFLLIIFGIAGWSVAVTFVYKWIVLGRHVLNIEDQVELSLDILDHQYKQLGIALEIPLATNDVTAHAIVAAIKNAHAAVLCIAHKLANVMQVEEKIDE